MKHKSYIYAALTACLLCSCGDSFLDKRPQGSIDENALQTPAGIELLVTSTYANLTEDDWGASPMNWVFGSIYGGDANKGSDSGDQPPVNFFETYQLLANNDYLNQKWNWVYKGVNRANNALKVMKKTTLTPEFALQKEAELRFLRGYFYFDGIRIFRMIPWVDETITENDPKVRNDQDIYPMIEKDLQFAAENLKATPGQRGRANNFGAKAMLAKVYMQQGKYAEALPLLKDVIDNGVTADGQRVALEAKYGDNFRIATENGPESIFAIQFSVDDNQNANSGISIAYPHNSGPGGCCGFYQPSYELMNSYKVNSKGLPLLDRSYRNGASVCNVGKDNSSGSSDLTIAVDPRIDIALGRFNVPYIDWGVPKNDWVRDYYNGGPNLPKKHVFSKEEQDGGFKGVPNGWAPGSALNFVVIRYADVLLSCAECLVQTGGSMTEAMNYVNQVRQRAANPAGFVKNGNQPAANYQIGLYTIDAFSDKEAALDIIFFERKLEFSMEGHRYFDLARRGFDYLYKEINEYVNYEKTKIVKFNSASSSGLTSDKMYFPIPENQILSMGIDENGVNYLQQNKGW